MTRRTLLQHAVALADAFPDGGPVYLDRMAEIFWPGADWLKYRVNRHNGGSRRGARVAAGMAGKLERLGYVKCGSTLPRCYWVKVSAIRLAQDLDSIESLPASTHDE